MTIQCVFASLSEPAIDLQKMLILAKKKKIIFSDEAHFDLGGQAKLSQLGHRKPAHTYIIGHYNPSVRIIDLVSHTSFSHQFLTLVSHTYSLKSTPNDRFFSEKLFMAILFTLRVFARNLLRGNRLRTTFRISF